MKRSIWIAGTAACLAGSLLLSGCGNGTGKNGGEPVGEINFPLEETVKMTYWMPLDGNVSKTTSTMNDTELYKELAKRTNVELEFLHPPLGQSAEQFNLMIASNEYPDIFEYDITSYQGGAQKALLDELIIPLNDKMEQYAPNLSALLKENPEWDKNVKTDDGTYYTFPFIREDDFLRVYAGAIVRADWMKELGLETPQTVEDWETMLKAFKEKKGAENPFAFELKKLKSYDLIAGAYGVGNSMYLDEGGQVQFGPIMPAYKDYLTKMKSWFDQGLLDRDFATNDAAAVKTKMTTGKSGLTLGGSGGTLGGIMQAMEAKDPAFELAGIPYPTQNKGERARYGQLDPASGQNAFISTMCATPEVAMKFLDYGYGEEGHNLFNFGLEGTSYTMENGKATYTDQILHNGEGLPIAAALCKYARATYNGPFVQDSRYIEQYLQLPQQMDAVRTWADTDAKSHVMPATTPTIEESERYGKIMADVETYCEEMYLKFVLGSESLDQFDAYVQNVKNMGIEEALQIQRGAYERYLQR